MYQHSSADHVLVVGDAGVGKTNYINYIVGNPFERRYIPTEGIKKYIINNKIIYDFPGQEKCREIYPRFITHVIIIYDVTSRISYRSINFWLKKIREKYHNSNIDIKIIGNKIDSPDRKIFDQSTDNISVKI